MENTEGKSIKEKLEILNDFSGEKISTLEMVEILGRNASHFLVILFATPMLMPITAFPGLSQIVSTAMIVLLAQLAIGKRILWLPKKVAKYEIEQKLLKKITAILIKYHKKIERFIKPRFPFLTSIPAVKFHYVYLIFIVLVLALPIPAPFANTIPAISIILITFGIIEREGMSILVGYLFGLLGTLYMAMMIYLGREFYRTLFGM